MSTARAAPLIAASSELSTAVVLFHAQVAAELGLHGTDHKTLALLREHGPLSPGKLAELTGLTSGSVTALIDRLEHAGLVRRVRNEEDRRQQRVELIPEGMEKLAPAFTSIARATTKLAARYTDRELTVILEFLEASTAMLRNESEKLRTRR